MADSDRVKRSHYVPKSYLRRFTNEREQICVYDKTSDRIFSAAIGNIASEKGFYDLPDWTAHYSINKQLPEKIFSVWEQGWSNALEHAIRRAEEGRTQPIKKERKPLFAHLILMQLLRTPLQREITRQIANGSSTLVKTYADKHRLVPPEGYPVDTSEESLLISQVDTLFDAERGIATAEILLNHIWIIGENKSTAPFYTSDSPVAMRGHLGNVGVNARGIEIVFPLNPKYILILVDRKVHHLARKYENRILPISSKFVEHYNALQVTNCYRQVYSRDDNFDVAKGVCATSPHIRNKYMPRVESWSPSLR